MTSARDIVRDTEWLAHRYDENADGYRFIRLTREQHRSVTFITDEYLEGTADFEFVPRAAIDPAELPSAPLHFIFHSAYCCSTVLARAFDIEDVSMGMKEPVLLNDMVGWRRRGAEQGKFVEALDLSLRLLARPFGTDRAVVAKPSNIVNHLAFTMLSLRPEARAVLLYAPIEHYLRSIARKGLWGRRWVRELFTGLLKDRIVIGGFNGEELLELTDLQIAALGWLSQHALFAALAQRFPDRVRTLDSETLLAKPTKCMEAAGKLFGLGIDTNSARAIAKGPAFSRSSKDGAAFDKHSRDKDQLAAAKLHGDEIEKVAAWAAEVARSQGVAMKPPLPLV